MDRYSSKSSALMTVAKTAGLVIVGLIALNIVVGLLSGLLGAAFGLVSLVAKVAIPVAIVYFIYQYVSNKKK